MRIDLVKLFCNIHDFWMNFENQWNQMLLAQGKRSPRRLPGLHPSEVMTIIILFHRLVIWRPWLYIGRFSREITRVWCTINHKTALKYEKQIDAFDGQAIIAKKRNCRNHYRPAQEYLSNRAQ